MKRIHAMCNNNDRIICMSEAVPTKVMVKSKNKYSDAESFKTTLVGRHTFYYQPAGTSQRIYLFTTKKYFQSVADLFSGKGVMVCDRQDVYIRSYSMTLGELHKVKECHQKFILEKVMDRIRMLVEEVIRYELDVPTAGLPVIQKCFRTLDAPRECRYPGDERAA